MRLTAVPIVTLIALAAAGCASEAETTASMPSNPSAATTPVSEAAAAPAPVESVVVEPAATTAAPSAEVLTVENSPDLAALLVEPDPCAANVGQFAASHRGSTIALDGNIGFMGNHGDADTRFDILIQPGDFSETSAIGPTFQFRDVGIADLHLTGPNIPDQIRAGDNLKIVAKVGSFDSGNCLFQLDPVSVEFR